MKNKYTIEIEVTTTQVFEIEIESDKSNDVFDEIYTDYCMYDFYIGEVEDFIAESGDILLDIFDYDAEYEIDSVRIHEKNKI